MKHKNEVKMAELNEYIEWPRRLTVVITNHTLSSDNRYRWDLFYDAASYANG